MAQRRWLRIIPVALIMYTIAYVDRTNISLALDKGISSMMKDLAMDDQMKGEAAGIFFFGYLTLQIPGGWLAARWSARKLVSVLLVGWGACAIGCGLAHTFRQFEAARFLLGVAESGVFPATLVLLNNWFPRAERARSNAYWQLCQPLALVTSAPITSRLLGLCGWQKMLIFEGLLPFVWLPIWWFLIRDHPREAPWISTEERDYLEETLRREQSDMPASEKLSWLQFCLQPTLAVMVVFYFLHNCAAYGCMTFFTDTLKGRGFTDVQYGLLFAVPYALTAVVMVVNSRHSDKTQERRAHVAAVYTMSGISLILSVLLRQNFWVSYAFLCFAIPGPFAGMAVFWAIPAETLPRATAGPTIGAVNALGNIGGFAGPYFVGWLTRIYHSTAIPFNYLGAGMIVCAILAFQFPKPPRTNPAFP